MILLTHICDKCHTAVTEEITLEAGQVEYVNMPQDWVAGVCPVCLHAEKLLEEYRAAEEKELFSP